MAYLSKTKGTGAYKRRQAREGARRAARHAAAGDKPVAASPTPTPYLDPTQQGNAISEFGQLAGQGVDATANLRDTLSQDAAVQAAIDENYGRSTLAQSGQLAGRGLASQGVSEQTNSQLWDVAHTRDLARIEQTRVIGRAQDRHNAIVANIQARQGALQQANIGLKLGNLYSDNEFAAAGSPGGTAQPAAPAAPGAAPVVKPVDTRIGLQGQRPGDVNARKGQNRLIVPAGNRAFTPGGRPIGLYPGSPKGWAISQTPKGRTVYTRQRTR